MNLAIIGARGNSKGIPKKNMQDLGGKPLLAWTIEAALKSNRVNEVVVSSEDTEIETYCLLTHGINGKFRFHQRSNELAQDHVQTGEVAFDVLRNYELRGINVDTVTLLSPTSPFRTVEQINQAVELYEGVGTVLTVFEDRKYHWLYGPGTQITPLHHDPERRFGRQWMTFPITCENGSIYVTGAAEFSAKLCYRNPPFFPLIVNDPVEIDNPRDLEYARFLLANQ